MDGRKIVSWWMWLQEEQDVLEELVAKETFNMHHFDRAVTYLNEKGFVVPDTDESDTGEDEEEEEEFKNILHEELLLKEPPKGTRKTKGRQKKLEPLGMAEERPQIKIEQRPPLMKVEVENGVEHSSAVNLRYLPLLTEIKEEPLDPEPCLVLNSYD